MKNLVAAALCAALASAAVAGPAHRHATKDYAVRVLDSSVSVEKLPDSGPTAFAIIEISERSVVTQEMVAVTRCGQTAGRFARFDIKSRKPISDDAYFIEGSRIMDVVAYEICALGADWIEAQPEYRRPASKKGNF